MPIISVLVQMEGVVFQKSLECALQEAVATGPALVLGLTQHN